jgi:hypothetical protein
VSGSDLRIHPDRLPDQFNCPLRSLCLKGNDSEQMQRVKVVWLLTQNFPINALRLHQLSLLMQRHSLIELGLQYYRSRILCLRSGTTCLAHCYFS